MPPPTVLVAALTLLTHAATTAAALSSSPNEADHYDHRGLRHGGIMMHGETPCPPSSATTAATTAASAASAASYSWSTTRFWIITLTLFLTLSTLLLCLCKKYGTRLSSIVEEGWINNRARGELSEANYVRRVLARREERERRRVEARREDPERRMGRLRRRLRVVGAVMTVKETDFVRKSDAEPARRDQPPQQRQQRQQQDDDGDGADLECGDGATAAAGAVDVFTNEADDGDIRSSSNNDNNNSTSNDALDASIGSRSSRRSRSSRSTANAHTHINLPPPPAPNGSRPVPNCCAICLAEYEINDVVIWSPNPSCVHAFHGECIVEWLGKMQDGTPCPCCRQTFVELPCEDDDEDDGAGGRKRLNTDMTRGSSFSEGDVPAAFAVDRISIR
eukprot:CAMPEP_0178633550 /NCGR_PEP_ID=MMETSP0698-20121128/12143_1 /TAXON_ID=265572 /ORGANISM="Extubocellulus spinifer, Strain CCMP396" /LENGTH=391 /DNA_ID=CAMNT_0020273131 /DNA_START=39 /DNA_END=1214 /DNA_ORIENTATION=+